MTFLNPILAFVALVHRDPIVIHILMCNAAAPSSGVNAPIEAYQRDSPAPRILNSSSCSQAEPCLLVVLSAMAVGKPILDAAGAVGLVGRTHALHPRRQQPTASLAEDQSPSALERHKSTALKLVAELEQSRGDRVGLITLASPADATILPATGDLSGVAGVIRDLKPTDANRLRGRF